MSLLVIDCGHISRYLVKRRAEIIHCEHDAASDFAHTEAFVCCNAISSEDVNETLLPGMQM